MSLGENEIEQYSRQIVLSEIGFDGQEKIKNATVTIIGTGGLGTPIAQQLVAMGIGKLKIVDRDVVEISNLHRQILYGPEDIGLPKAEVAADKLKILNPNVEVIPIVNSINDYTATKIIEGSDVVLDGLDSISARYALNSACVKLKIPYIFGSAIETTGSVTTIVPNETPCLECFQPNLKDENMPKCSIQGVHPSILNIISTIQVAESIRLITEKKPLLQGKIFFSDISTLSFDKIKIIKQDSCEICGKNTSNKTYVNWKFIENICSRESGKSVHIITPKKDLNILSENIKNIIKIEGYKIRKEGKLGITFQIDQKISISLINNGIAIITGADTENHALEIFEKIVNKNTNTNEKVIENKN